MFFVISKIVWALISPLNLILLLLLAGAGLSFFCRRAGITLAGLSIFLLFFIGIAPMGSNLLASLENSYASPSGLPKEISGIIILGGTFDAELTAARNSLAVNDSMERVMEGLRLARRYPLAITVFSGGEGRMFLQGRPETREIMRWLGRAGYNPDDFLFEDKSRNTWENVAFTRDMLNPGAQEVWIVVTSAYHMPRAMKVFRLLDWPGTIIPWPVDYRTDGKMRWFPDRFDVAGNFYKTDLAIHEFAGIFAYELRGKTASP